MALSLEQLQAAFKKQDTNESRPSNYYRFWDMKTDERAVIRILPDANEDNSMGFMVEKLMHILEINGENKAVPCLKMYDEDCPICNVSKAYYKDEGKESVNGKKYWRKKQHILQALIVEDPLAVNPETGENCEGKVMLFNFGYQLYSVIKEEFASGDLERTPYLFEGGTDFIIKKSDLGGRAKYDVGSKFARRSSDLTDDEIALVEDESVDLSTLLPPNPGLEKVESMLEAALTGEVFEDDNSSDSEPAASKTTASEEPAETKSEPAAEYTEEAIDVLASIRNRKKKNVE